MLGLVLGWAKGKALGEEDVHKRLREDQPRKRALNNRAYKRSHNNQPRRVYNPHGTSRSRGSKVIHLPMHEDIARVDVDIQAGGRGRVMWNAVSFPAYCLSRDEAFMRNMFVRVRYRQGNTLYVEGIADPTRLPLNLPDELQRDYHHSSAQPQKEVAEQKVGLNA